MECSVFTTGAVRESVGKVLPTWASTGIRPQESPASTVFLRLPGRAVWPASGDRSQAGSPARGSTERTQEAGLAFKVRALRGWVCTGAHPDRHRMESKAPAHREPVSTGPQLPPTRR